VAGLDEVGYGPWAGPLLACATILSPQFLPQFLKDNLNDSKKLSKNKRQQLRNLLKEQEHTSCWYAIGIASVEEIDRLNVRNANLLAMKRAIETLPIRPKAVLVDGSFSPCISIPLKNIAKGDQVSLSIAAASIIAKVERDRLMDELAQAFPQYGWQNNAGYGTAQHQAALIKYGVTPHHRKSYKPIAQLLGKD